MKMFGVALFLALSLSVSSAQLEQGSAVALTYKVAKEMDDGALVFGPRNEDGSQTLSLSYTDSQKQEVGSVLKLLSATKQQLHLRVTHEEKWIVFLVTDLSLVPGVAVLRVIIIAGTAGVGHFSVSDTVGQSVVLTFALVGDKGARSCYQHKYWTADFAIHAWDNATSYDRGAIVLYNDVFWQAQAYGICSEKAPPDSSLWKKSEFTFNYGGQATKLTTWTEGVEYAKYSVVFHDERVWLSVVENNAMEPAAEGATWARVQVAWAPDGSLVSSVDFVDNRRQETGGWLRWIYSFFA
jgi:hypothetical protein